MITKRQFIDLVGEASFLELFVTELGWNRFRGQSELPAIIVDDVDYNFTAIAERNGFQILICRVDAIPTNSICKKIDTKLRRQANDYITIFQLNDTDHHLWMVPVKANEKRDIVFVEYECAEKSDFLFSKIDGFSFEIGEETTIVDLRAKVQGTFAINSEKITRDFYTGFKKEHAAFAKFITGIDDQIPEKENKTKQWYTSVMLNRLMFCYFIQKKGFLNLDFDYLRHKLEWVRQEQGENKFFGSFYKGFLVHLFQGGLNSPQHSQDFERVYGKIPYLNGGMFDQHQIEQDYSDIDIADEAFIRLFDFFDTWCWHLDTRITASGKDINPDVLGYIFEQYINDRAQMGAYYTKEDITEYIGRNCILPFLFDKVAAIESEKRNFKPEGFVWTTLRESGDRYIFDAVKKGYDHYAEIPEEIKQGIITGTMVKEYCQTPIVELPESHVPLSELRSQWNKLTPETWALPTEIWRETIERLMRCKNILEKINHGEITSINDFITYNLDIRLFTLDLLAKADRLFIKHFYEALQKISILDPTCGSGAFLFAAMNILEPLYEACIDRMQEQPEYFKNELAEISDKYRSNIQYFIFKSIILRNLYGVDIMVEATEIAKLRLFLKMVAVVDVDRRQPNLGLDPLPDIDFNIRCGNTLVGYANEEQLNKVLSFASDILQDLANQQFKKDIEQEMEVVATTFERFKELQLMQVVNLAEFKNAKVELRSRLAKLNSLLNHKLFLSTHINASDDDIFVSAEYEEWKESHKPFHWFAEFYQIIHGNGGFDVIIGNPPYVNVNKIHYVKNSSSFACQDLYGYVLRRIQDIVSPNGTQGMIIMHNIAFSRDFRDIRTILTKDSSVTWWSFFSRIPSGLFDGSVRVRNAIYIKNKIEKDSRQYSTRLQRWFSNQRPNLFKTIEYGEIDIVDTIPMTPIFNLLSQINATKYSVRNSLITKGTELYFKGTGYNWITLTDTPPFSKDENGADISYDIVSSISIRPEDVATTVLMACGKFGFINWMTYGDDFHVTKKDIISIVIPKSLSEEDKGIINTIFLKFKEGLQQAYQTKVNAGKVIGSFNIASLWPITDVSDFLFIKYICPKWSEADYYKFIDEVVKIAISSHKE